MFILVRLLERAGLEETDLRQTTISDLIQISPEDFQKPSAEALEDNINSKYAKKVWKQASELQDAESSVQVLQEIGLCICMYDLLKASEGLIGHGTGIVNVNGEVPGRRRHPLHGRR